MTSALTPVAWALLSFILTAMSLPLMRRLARKAGIVASPCGNAAGDARTPLLGGVAIVGATLTVLAIARVLPAWMLIGAVGLLMVGFIDDVLVLAPFRKFLMQVGVVVMVIALAPHYGLTPWPWLSAALAVFWLVSTVNAFLLSQYK